MIGFDSFEGLREDWAGTDVEKGHFNLDGKIPKLNKNVIQVGIDSFENTSEIQELRQKEFVELETYLKNNNITDNDIKEFNLSKSFDKSFDLPKSFVKGFLKLS